MCASMPSLGIWGLILAGRSSEIDSDTICAAKIAILFSTLFLCVNVIGLNSLMKIAIESLEKLSDNDLENVVDIRNNME